MLKLQVIWEDAIQRELGIDLNDLPQYRAVLVIPALYKYSHNLFTQFTSIHAIYLFLLQQINISAVV